MKKPSQKQLEKAVEQAWYKLASGVQVNIMDLGKIFDRGVAALKEGKDLDTEIKACIEEYRRN